MTKVLEKMGIKPHHKELFITHAIVHVLVTSMMALGGGFLGHAALTSLYRVSPISVTIEQNRSNALDVIAHNEHSEDLKGDEWSIIIASGKEGSMTAADERCEKNESIVCRGTDLTADGTATYTLYLASSCTRDRVRAQILHEGSIVDTVITTLQPEDPSCVD